MKRSLLTMSIAMTIGAAALAATMPVFTPKPTQIVDPPPNVASFGATVAGAGDLNGDDVDDILISAPNATGAVGQIYAYLGSGGAYPSQPSWTSSSIDSDLPHRLGRLLAAGHDIDGDGYDDFVASATLRGTSEALYAFRGGPQGPVDEPLSRLAGLTLSSGITSIALCRDIDGDAFADLVVGLALHSSSENEQGRINVYYGSPTGFSRTPDWFVIGAQAGARLGTAVACGDVNGDGFDDVLASAPMSGAIVVDPSVDRGYALMFRGSSRGLSTTPSWEYQTSERDAAFGQTLTIAGDLNGDGLTDLAIGSPRLRSPESFNLAGRVDIFLARAQGLGTAPDVRLFGSESDSGYGLAVAALGDVDRDGFADLAIGSGQPDTNGVLGTGPAEEGQLVVYRGGREGLAADRFVTVKGNAGPTGFGFSLAGPLDANRDGLGDLLVGARAETAARGIGRVYLFRAIDLPRPERPRTGSGFFPDDAAPVFSFSTSTDGRYSLEFSRDDTFRYSRRYPRRDEVTAREYQPTAAEWTTLLRYSRANNELHWRVRGTSSTGSELIGPANVMRLRDVIGPDLLPRVGTIEATRDVPPTLRWFANHNQRFRLVFSRTTNAKRGPAISAVSGYTLRGESYEVPLDTWARVLTDVVDANGKMFVTLYGLDALGRRSPSSQVPLAVTP